MNELLQKRKGFNFYKSYYDVFLQLPEHERLNFITALLEKQFEGKEPQLEGLASFAYISQQHSINSQVEGFLNKTKGSIPPTPTPSVPPNEPPTDVAGDINKTTIPPSVPPSLQEKEKGQEKEEVEGKGQEELEGKLEDELKLFWNKRKSNMNNEL